MPSPRRFECAPLLRGSRCCANLLAAVSILSLTGQSAHALAPPPAYFVWTSTGTNSYSGDVGGTHGSIDFATSRNDTLTPKQLTAASPGFVAQFGSTIQSIVVSNGAAGTAADSFIQFAFTPSLPAGSRLIILDLDNDERMEFTRTGGAFNLLSRLESQTGPSVFPLWTPATGLLAGSQGDNDYEATVFDASGIALLTAHFLRDRGGGIGNTHLAFTVPVPEPATTSIVATLCIAGSQLRRQKARRPCTS